MHDLLPGHAHIKEHFHGDVRLANLAFLLFLMGIAIFAVNNTVLFFIKDEAAYFIPRLCMRFLTSVSWLSAAILGAKWNRTKRNSFLIPALVLYLIADVIVFFSIPASAFFYGAGHIFLLFAIQQTTYFRKYQLAVFYTAVPLMAFSLIHFLNGFSMVVLLAIFLYSASVYNESRKEDVTRGDFLKLMKRAQKDGVRLWESGKWGVGFVENRSKLACRRLELAYDVAGEETLMKWLKECEYQEDGADNQYYSEKYGRLSAMPCTFRKDGSALMHVHDGEDIKLDKGFFHRVKVGDVSFGCLIPVRQALLRKELVGTERGS